jgi:hypothetical protein
MWTRVTKLSLVMIGLIASSTAIASDNDALIDSALSAAPASVTDAATIKDNDGNVLREGKSGFTCYPQAATAGPMCNDAHWDALLAAKEAKQPFSTGQFGVSYMLAGEGDAIGVSNSDPYASAPTSDNDWIKEGPHMMLIVPDPAMLEGLSTNSRDPVYVMWKNTPYEHVMIRIAQE